MYVLPGVNIFILVEPLAFLTAVTERVRTKWVVKMFSLTSVSSPEGGKINLFFFQSKVWCGSFLIAFLLYKSFREVS